MPSNRFYDQEPSVSRAVELLLIFPDDIQTLIASGISSMAEQAFQVNDLLRELKSLGTETVLAFYKSKQRKRNYDQNPVVHKALNDLMVLSPENRTFLSRKVLGLMTHLHDYLSICKQYAVEASLTIMQEAIQLYVQHGSAEVTRHLRHVEAVVVNKNRRRLMPAQVIMDADVGLRLRQNDEAP